MTTKKKKKRGPTKAVRMRRLLKKCSEAWSKAVRQRDGRCLICGVTDNLQAHHWLVSRARSRKYRFDLRNGVSLCYAHHVHGIHTEASLAFLMAIMKNVTFMDHAEAISIAQSATGDTSEPFTEEDLIATLDRLTRSPEAAGPAAVPRVSPLPADPNSPAQAEHMARWEPYSTEGVVTLKTLELIASFNDCVVEFLRVGQPIIVVIPNAGTRGFLRFPGVIDTWGVFDITFNYPYATLVVDGMDVLQSIKVSIGPVPEGVS